MVRVSDKAAGWYPDPDGDNRQRYWDGDSWTEYYTPLAPERAEIHGASSAVSDYPYLVASRSGAPHDLMATPVQANPHGGWPTAPADGGDGETQEFSGGGKRSRASVWALVAASLLVVMLVVGVAWWAFRPDSAPIDGGTDPSTPHPGDGETVTEELTIGAATRATVPEAGLWVGMLTLDADTTIAVDARAGGNRDDLRITIVAEGTDDPLAGNDDRGNNLANLGDNALNPFATASLPAGRYEVRVDERNAVAADFDITVTAVTEVLTSGSTVDITVAENSFWAGTLTVSERDGPYRIDVSGITTSANPNPDAVVVVVGDTDRQYVNDDRDADDRDPLLEQDLPPGTWVVVVYDFRVRSLTAEITVTTA